MLDVIDALGEINEEDQLAQDATSTNITGTKMGQDLGTQITTFLTGQTLTLLRSVSDTARVDIDGAGQMSLQELTRFLQNSERLGRSGY